MALLPVGIGLSTVFVVDTLPNFGLVSIFRSTSFFWRMLWNCFPLRSKRVICIRWLKVVLQGSIGGQLPKKYSHWEPMLQVVT